MALSLLASLLLITLVTETIAWIGKGRIAEVVRSVHALLPCSSSWLCPQLYSVYARSARLPGHSRQRALKAEILATKAELSRTSSQDEFAKWARLRRKVDKGIADLEKLSACTQSALRQRA
jgi:hypothetical protein